MQAPLLYCILLIDASSAMVRVPCSVIMHCGFFYVLLTVHLSIILAINQLNAQNLLL